MLGSHHDNLREEEEDLLQFAIQQSLVEAGSEYDQVRDAGLGYSVPTLLWLKSFSQFRFYNIHESICFSLLSLSLSGDGLGGADQQQARHSLPVM